MLVYRMSIPRYARYEIISTFLMFFWQIFVRLINEYHMIKGNVVEKLPSYGVLQAPQKENKWNVVVWRERLNKKEKIRLEKQSKKVKTTKETISKETKRQDQKRKGKNGKKRKDHKSRGKETLPCQPLFRPKGGQRPGQRERELGKETEDHTFGWQVQGVW